MERIEIEQSIVTNKRKYQTHQLQNINCRSIRSNAISALLLMTSVLERSLGDMLASSLALKGITNKKVPKLLRDLILDETLQELIDSKVTIFLIHVLLGTPRSLNLRNIVWHGFSCVPDFPDHSYESSSVFVSTIYILIRHLGKKIKVLKETSFPSFYMQWRPKHSLERVDKIYMSIGAVKLKNVINRLELDVLERWNDLENSEGLRFMATKRSIVENCIDSYKKSNFWLSLCLLVPEWEFVARVLFTIVNKCDERIQTAESDELYTTFDEILSHQINDQNNRFPQTIGLDHMELLLDFLVLPEGPRLRDKISHGEVSSDDKFVQKGLDLVIASYLDITYAIQNISGSSNILDINSSLISGYNSQYHPTSLLIENIMIASDGIQKLSGDINLSFLISEFKLKQEDCLNIFINDHEFMDKVHCMLSNLNCLHSSQQSKSLKNFSVCATQISKLFSMLLPGNCKELDYEYLNTSKYGRNQISFKKASTLYRSKREYELWTLCRKITYNITSSVSIVTENIRDRRRQIEEKTLRSRQRSTCKRMIETIPLIEVTHLCLLTTILNYLLDFYSNTIADVDEKDFSKLLKTSKKYLKISENINVNVDITKNRWEESAKLSKDVVQMLKLK